MPLNDTEIADLIDQLRTQVEAIQHSGGQGAALLGSVITLIETKAGLAAKPASGPPLRLDPEPALKAARTLGTTTFLKGTGAVEKLQRQLAAETNPFRRSALLNDLAAARQYRALFGRDK